MSTSTSAGKQRGSILRLPAVLARTGRSRTSWYEDIKAGRAPIGIRIGPRAVGWFEEDINAWLAALATSAEQEVR